MDAFGEWMMGKSFTAKKAGIDACPRKNADAGNEDTGEIKLHVISGSHESQYDGVFK